MILREKAKGFTLAEVLLTLAILGVLTVITIPTLTQDFHDANFKTAWKKAYSDVEQASIKIALENNNSLRGVFGNNFVMRDEFLKQLSSIKACGDASTECWTYGEWKYLNGNPMFSLTSTSAVLNNGSFILFSKASQTCTYASYPTGSCGIIYVDVNGKKKPNTIGKDIFAIHVLDTRIKPFGTEEDSQDDLCDPNGTGYSCSAYYLLKD